MTYRDRRLAKAARLRGWADKRTSDASATLAALDALPYAHDIAFLTQPGRIPLRTRFNATEARSFASLDKAARMASRADSIERAADHAIYSDDPDAIDRLRDKIVRLSVDLAARKSANAVYRKAHRAELAGMTAWGRSQAVPFPSYAITNLSGNIGRMRARLAHLERVAAATRKDL